MFDTRVHLQQKDVKYNNTINDELSTAASEDTLCNIPREEVGREASFFFSGRDMTSTPHDNIFFNSLISTPS